MGKRKVFRFELFCLIFFCLMAGVFAQQNGDVNIDGRITIVDALMTAQYAVRIQVSNFHIEYADANCDDNITIIDALIIAQFSVRLIPSIPDCGNPGTPRPTPVPPTIMPTPVRTGHATHVTGNPFSGRRWYIDEIWSDLARTNGGAAIADQPTMVWMDRIGAIYEAGGIGLEGHLDRCLAQNANLFLVSIYNLPNRDCSADASNGELLIAENGMERYKYEYIDPIAEILSMEKYEDIHIIALIEIDSLPNLITNKDLPKCREAAGAGGYVEGVQYTLNVLSRIPNVYKYVDIAHSGWLGWDSNREPMCDLLREVVSGTDKGFDSVDGFASNTCNYTPLDETFMPDPHKQVGGQQIMAADFYEYNPYFDEEDFMIEMHRQLSRRGFRNFGMIHDTARNGWGGSSYGKSRPTRASSSSNLNTYVNESRIDRRYHRGNWCNQESGIGERPTANTGIPECDAFVWIKPPGESDGISYDGPADPNDPAKQFDKMCDPLGQSTYNSAYGTGAMDAPHAGRWNQVQFDALLRNAYPRL